jgi:capsule biosynthesis phosphatase
MRYCFDIDGVIFEINENYKEYIPIKNTIKFIKNLKAKKHTIILYTARKMHTHKGNIGLVNKDIVEETLRQLRLHDIMYDEIYFGKPAADYYIDDKAINFYDMELMIMNQGPKEINGQNINVGVLDYRLNEIEKSLEKNMEQILNKIDKLIDQHNQSELNQKALKVKVEKLEDEVKELKEIDKKVQEDVNSVKVSLAEKMGYGMAGGGLVTLLTKVLETFGGN